MKALPFSRLGRRLALPLLICFALAVAAAPAQALQGWQAPVGLRFQPLPYPSKNGAAPAAAAISSTGEAAIIDSFGRVESKAPGQSWGAPVSAVGDTQVLNGGFFQGGFPLVADNAGDLFTAWAAKGGNCGVAVEVAVKRVSRGTWGAPVAVWETAGGECLENPAVSGIRIAVNRRGDVALTWRISTSSAAGPSESAVLAATKASRGNWTGAERLSAPSETEASAEPQPAIDPAGNATVVWQTGSRVFLASGPAGGSWSEPESLSPLSGLTEPTVAVGDAGETLVAWCSNCGIGGAIEVVSKSAGGSWSAPEVISADAPKPRPRHPAIAIDPAGNATAIWANEPREVRTALRPAGGGWRKSIRLGGDLAGFTGSSFPVLAINAGGDAIAAWASVDSGRFIDVARRPRGSRWQAAVRMPHGSTLAKTYEPRVASDRAGNALVTWVEGRLSSSQARPFAAEYYAIPQPPSAPALLVTSPPSPADDNSPRISGAAPTESTVDLFTNPVCSGPPVASGTGAKLNERGRPADPPGLDVSVADNTTTSFYATATEEGETSSCAGPLTYVERTGWATVPEALAKMPALDTLRTPEDPLSHEGAWSTMHGAVGPGFVDSGGWSSHQPFPAVEAAYWAGSTFADTDTNEADTIVAASARVIASPGVEKRYFSLWLEMPKPATNKTGYELRFSVIGHNAYNAELRSWTNGAPTTLTTVEDVVLPSSSLAALVDQGTNLSIWVDAGAGYVELGSIPDSQFSSGYAGIATNGNGTRLRRFAAGELPIVSP